MRHIFAKVFQKLATEDHRIVFLTGDLGFRAFESLRQTMGSRFINAGVAEHNMVTVAAGLAYAGLKPWVYSIAPFITIKVLEEIRNDICFPKHDVKLIGLGGGFDYGIAGPTHHVLQDVAVMTSLPHMNVYLPAFPSDLSSLISHLYAHPGPAYIRLMKAQEPSISPPLYAPLRKLKSGKKVVTVVLGSLIQTVLAALDRLPPKEDTVEVWVASKLPLGDTQSLLTSLRRMKTVCIIEEHGEVGGLGDMVSRRIHSAGIPMKQFHHIYAKGYRSGKYGDRQFHLKENGLDEERIADVFRSFF